MKDWRIVAMLLLCIVLAGSISCNPFGKDKQEATQQTAKVVRGDLTVSVSGSGNIEVSNEAELAFGVGGRIDKMYVEESDNVTEGDVLAKLDTSALELALTQARVALTKQQVAITQAEVAVTQAQVALKTAEYNLKQAQDVYTLSDIKAAQADVVQARRDWEEALWIWYKYDPGTPGWDEYAKIVAYAQARLDATEDKLDAMLSGWDTEEVEIKKLEVKAAQQSLELAQQSLELAQQSLGQFQQSVEQAQKDLNEATITAPFDGVVAKIYADEGDVIPPPTMATKVIIHLVDLTTMELKVEVDEIDMPGVKLGQRAIIEADALPDVKLEGEVTYISFLGKEESGVVLYEVKISFDVPEDSGLRVGMSAEADIVINERNNVLLVPSQAIKQDSQGNSVVEVMVDGQIEERPVVIGISDGFQTEIVSGLNEGEVVVERRAKS